MVSPISHTFPGRGNALITGASRGLGLELARELIQHGWNVVIDARNADALTQASTELSGPGKVIALAGDVTNAAHRADLVQAVQQLGSLDLLINNASLLGPSPQPNLLAYPLDVLEQVYRTNVIAPLALIQDLQQYLHAGASIINITSDAGQEAYAGWGGYGSSKAALEHLSAILSAEQPEFAIYWVDPGDMNTQMQQEAFPAEDVSDRPLPEVSVPGILSLFSQKYPSGRYTARALPARNA
ncbi:short-chain dehydrogenase [Dictyobacter alpinus]|uniref:Short-chain dehydrogenase n=1 Tax=Dictyobacter alpinus TaxID=2014873 RepID=A0A402B8G5_9CHLR|nr:SDR family oxidoreductase [Dictyobacter alpinus]GCE27703.1 short-chain dehydrogenase [Dictyobacter alpinus]